MKNLKLLILFLLLPTIALAQPRTRSPITRGNISIIEEEDGSPTVSPYKIKVTNGSLTDNADGTASLSTLADGTVGYSELDSNLKYPAYYSWVASSTDSTEAIVTSDGSTVTLTVQKLGTGDLTILFSTGPTTVDCTPALTATLTAGSDTSPQVNYAFIKASAPTVITVNTTGYPTTEEFHPIGTYIIQSAATANTYGIYKAHNWTDHCWVGTTENGHIFDINRWIRTQPATWQSGVSLTPTLTTATTPDTLTLATTAGTVLQLHTHDFPVFNSVTAGDTAATTFFAVNHQTAYTAGKDLCTADFLQDASGNAVTVNKRISWVVWGVISEYSNDCKVFVNLPTGFYNTNALAIADDSKYSVYTIPTAYRGTGFLIAKLTYQVTNATAGSYALTLVENLDLRGLFPSLVAGGAVAAPTTFADNVFAIQDETDPTKQAVFSLGGATTAKTVTITSSHTDDRTVTLPDATGVIVSDATACTDLEGTGLSITTGVLNWKDPNEHHKSFVITSPDADADAAVWRSDEAITIKGVHGVQVGGTNIVGHLAECDANGLNCVACDDSDMTITTSNVNDDGTLSNPSIDAGDYVGWITTSVSGTITRATISFEYTIN